MAELTDKEREWCRLVAQGVSKAEAYRKAYARNDMSAAAANKAAYRLSQKGDILSFLDSLRTAADVAAVLSREARMEMLSRMAERSAARMDVGDAVSCIRELNKMDGAYAQPDGVQVNVQQGLSIGDVVASVMGVNVVS